MFEKYPKTLSLSILTVGLLCVSFNANASSCTDNCDLAYESCSATADLYYGLSVIFAYDAEATCISIAQQNKIQCEAVTGGQSWFCDYGYDQDINRCATAREEWINGAQASKDVAKAACSLAKDICKANCS